MTEAVIFIPGIMGSVLKDGDRVVWPGTTAEWLFGYANMAALCKPDLEATDIVRTASGTRQYSDLIEALATCGYVEGPDGHLRVLPYDWRKDNFLAAHSLADLVEDLANELSKDAAIILLAHSMGGLISRCYLESGLFIKRGGFNQVTTLITMGTPHKGAPIALTAVLGQQKRLWLSRMQVAKIANDTRFPSLYQLLPPRSEPFAWDREDDARLAPCDIYDEDLAQQLGLSAENLAAAQRFHDSLDLARRPATVRYFFFAGTHVKTVSSARIATRENGRLVECIAQENAGDGTVPFWSSTQPGVQTEPVGKPHGTIYQDGRLKTLLGSLLGRTGVLASTSDYAEIAVEPQVVNLSELFQLTIDFPATTTSYKGTLRMRCIESEDGLSSPGAEVTELVPIEYMGPVVDHLTVVLKAPQLPGVWSIELVDNGAVASTTTLFVQEESGTL